MRAFVFVVALFFSTTSFANPYNEKAVYFLTQRGALACLSHAIFQEANTESDLGKRYVIASVLNRTIKNNKPICDTLREKNQFSFYRKGFSFNKSSGELTNMLVLDTLGLAMKGKLTSLGCVTHFHRIDINPSWSRSKEFVRIRQINHHVFYREKEK